MLSALKTCFLIELICLSFCEASRIKRVVPVVLPPILNPPGSNSLSPLLNIKLVIDKPESTCCTSCNPPPTHEPCKPCPPPTTCKPCEICPTLATCEPCATPSPATTCEPCTTPTPVICEPCSTPSPTTCEPCLTCPTTTTQIDPCTSAGGIVCHEGNWCITKHSYNYVPYDDAVKNCSSLDILSFRIPDLGDLPEEKMICVRKTFEASEFGDGRPLWSLKKESCNIVYFTRKDGVVTKYSGLIKSPCDENYRFVCVADI